MAKVNITDLNEASPSSLAGMFVPLQADGELETKKYDLGTVDNRVTILEAGQATNRLTYATWPELSPVTGEEGQGAEVINDTGGHIDPVTGDPIANDAGLYVWSASPAGWTWVSEAAYAALSARLNTEVAERSAVATEYETTDLDAQGSIFTADDGSPAPRIRVRHDADGNVKARSVGTSSGNRMEDYETTDPAAIDSAEDESEVPRILGRRKRDGTWKTRKFETNDGDDFGSYETTDTATALSSAEDTGGIARLLERVTTLGKRISRGFETNAGTHVSDYETTDTAALETLDDSEGVARITGRRGADGSRTQAKFQASAGSYFRDYETTDTDVTTLFDADDEDGVPRIIGGFNRDGSLVSNGQTVATALPVEGMHYLRQWRSKTRSILRGNGSQVALTIIGDSYTYWSRKLSDSVGGYYLYTLAPALYEWLGNAGAGYISFTSALNGDTPPTLYSPNAHPSDIAVTLTGDLAQVEYTSPSPAYSHLTGDGAGKVTVTGPALPVLNFAELHYVGTADGNARYRWNGGSWNALDLSTTTDLAQIDVSTGIPGSGAWTLEIEWVSGTWNPAGVDVRSAASGIRISKLAQSGGRLQHVAALDETQWIDGQSALDPEMFMILLGTNDQGAARTASQFAGDLLTVINRIRVAAPTADILVVMPAENLRTDNAAEMSGYASSARLLCRSMRCAFVDMQAYFGEVPEDYGPDGNGFFDADDDVHPRWNTGFSALADGIFRLLAYSN